jgi:hypothetical protein
MVKVFNMQKWRLVNRLKNPVVMLHWVELSKPLEETHIQWPGSQQPCAPPGCPALHYLPSAQLLLQRPLAAAASTSNNNNRVWGSIYRQAAFIHYRFTH